MTAALRIATEQRVCRNTCLGHDGLHPATVLSSPHRILGGTHDAKERERESEVVTIACFHDRSCWSAMIYASKESPRVVRQSSLCVHFSTVPVKMLLQPWRDEQRA